MITTKSPTWVEISQEAFFNNIASYKKIIGNTVALACVIKSNAYGHGLDLIASLCEAHNGVAWICVVSLSEAIKLREHGIQKPILVLSIIDADLEAAVAYNIALVAYDMTTVHELNTIAQLYNKKASVHVKIDTGLSRLGNLTKQAINFIVHIAQLPFIALGGIFTHLADSERDNATFAYKQIAELSQLVNELQKNNITIPLQHFSCSAAIPFMHPGHYNLARTGIGIYGLWPSLINKERTHERIPSFNLKSVLTWKTRIIQLKEVPPLSYIGYDRTYITIRTTRIAILPVGYWDGYDRLLSNRGQVLLHNHLCPVRGRVAMNMIIIDVTEVPSATVGDEVVLLGDYPGVTADDIAEQCSTINYEIVTRINPLLPRIAVQ